MAVRDLTEYFQGHGQEYPNVPSRKHPAGKTYRVPSPDAATGLLLAGLGNLGARAAVGASLSSADLGRIKLDDAGERDFYRLVLGCSKECREQAGDDEPAEPCGSVYHEMLDDGVGWDWFEKIAQDAYLIFAFDEQVADRMLAGQGKATPVPNRSDRRAAAKKTAGRKSGRASGATASQTRRQASTASSSPTGSPAKAKAAKKAG